MLQTLEKLKKTTRRRKVKSYSLKEAQLQKVSCKANKNHFVIKLPKSAIDYLKIDPNTNELFLVPINGVLQVSRGNTLNLIPALDLNSMEDIFTPKK